MNVLPRGKFTKKELIIPIKKSWSHQSSSKWSKDNPARGQC